MNSYQNINYKLRPQKRIERALFSEIINRFIFNVQNKVNYIGMGSLFFTDFVYFSKTTTIDKMISIEAMDEKTPEKTEAKRNRFINNKPLDRITLVTKYVKDAIEDDDIPFDEHNFIWLDYDTSFYPSFINDLAKIVEKEQKTSIIAITYNSGVPSKYKSEDIINTAECLKDYTKYSSPEIVEDDFVKSKYGYTVRKICESYLQREVEERNSIDGTSIELTEITTIHYRDGVNMSTIVWLLSDSSFDKDKYISDIRGLDINENINLEMEILTLYEKQQLDRSERKDHSDVSKEMGISLKTVEQYYKYSKYIPEYTEVLI